MFLGVLFVHVITLFRGSWFPAVYSFPNSIRIIYLVCFLRLFPEFFHNWYPVRVQFLHYLFKCFNSPMCRLLSVLYFLRSPKTYRINRRQFFFECSHPSKNFLFPLTIIRTHIRMSLFCKLHYFSHPLIKSVISSHCLYLGIFYQQNSYSQPGAVL